MLRRVELKNRAVVEGDSPWSIRQTAVYHRLESNIKGCDNPHPEESKVAPVESRSTFLLISPPENVELQFVDCLEQNTSKDDSPLSIWNTHRILIADSLRGWMDYIAYLEQRLKHQVSQLTGPS
jgi:hypothetical protein